MYSRLFYFLMPLVVVTAIIGFSALAENDHAAMKHDEPAVEKQAGGMQARVSPDALVQGRETAFTLTLAKDNLPVSLAALEERHTRKIHLLVVDESMADYHHLHPVAGGEAGTYTFAFTPNTAHNYMLYADVKPLNGAAQMIPVKLNGAVPCAKDCLDKSAADRVTAGDVTAQVVFDGKTVKAGAPVNAEVILTGTDGKPLADLEPVMGAYGHIVGFYEGFKAVAHMHPMGAEPEKPEDRGASPVKFMLHPDHPGYLKYFVQIRRGGKDVFLPFGINIEK